MCRGRVDGTRTCAYILSWRNRHARLPDRSGVQSRESASDPGCGGRSPGGAPAVTIIARSAWHETAPVGGPAGQEDFLNGALRLETSLGPHELLACLQQIEDQLGRRAQRDDGDRGPSIWTCCCTTIWF